MADQVGHDGGVCVRMNLFKYESRRAPGAEFTLVVIDKASFKVGAGFEKGFGFFEADDHAVCGVGIGYCCVGGYYCGTQEVMVDGAPCAWIDCMGIFPAVADIELAVVP